MLGNLFGTYGIYYLFISDLATKLIYLYFVLEGIKIKMLALAGVN